MLISPWSYPPDILIFTLFIILALMGFVFQLYLAKSDTKLKKIKEGGCKGAQCHCHAQYNKVNPPVHYQEALAVVKKVRKG